MKHFEIKGPETTRIFDIEDSQMLAIHVISIDEYEKLRKFGIDNMLHCRTFRLQNEAVTNNSEHSEGSRGKES